MAENRVGSETAERLEYEKPVIKTIGSASELTMASSTNMAHNGDSGCLPDAYS